MLVSFPFKRNQTIQLTPEHQLQLPDSDHHLCSPVPPPHLPHGPHNLYSHSFKKNLFMLMTHANTFTHPPIDLGVSKATFSLLVMVCKGPQKLCAGWGYYNHGINSIYGKGKNLLRHKFQKLQHV